MKMAQVNDFIDFLGGYRYVSLLSDIMGCPTIDTLADTETFKAYKFVLKYDPNWIKKTKERINKDFNNARSYLGELRAYADILRFPFYKVTANLGDGPDFELTGKGTNEKIKIEVYTQFPKENCTQSLQVDKACLRETIVTPLLNWNTTLKKTKLSDVSIAKGTIISIGGSKKDAHQVDPNIPTYLYIDFQQIWGLDCEQALPLLSQSEFLTTGILWMAFYGKKGMPILENFSMQEPASPVKMSDDGFLWKSPSNGFAGVLLRCQKNRENPLVFLENPKRKTSHRFICSLLQSGLMNVEKSCWSYSGVSSWIHRANATIRAIVHKDKQLLVKDNASKK